MAAKKNFENGIMNFSSTPLSSIIAKTPEKEPAPAPAEPIQEAPESVLSEEKPLDEELTVKEEKAPEIEKEKAAPKKKKTEEPQEKRKPGRPKDENLGPKKRLTLDVDAELISDVSKILIAKYKREDKMSLTKIIDEVLRNYVGKNKAYLDKYNQFFGE